MYVQKKSNIMVSICTCCIVKAEKCEVNAKQNRRKKKTLFSFFLPQYFEFSRLNTIWIHTWKVLDTFRYIELFFGYIWILSTLKNVRMHMNKCPTYCLLSSSQESKNAIFLFFFACNFQLRSLDIWQSGQKSGHKVSRIRKWFDKIPSFSLTT